MRRLVPAGVLAALLSAGFLGGDAGAAERAGPVLIGALTESWGPTPGIVGLRDGLVELGYRENEQFVIGVRFTQGDLAALSEAARELVQQRVDILFTSEPGSVKAAQRATTRIPIVFAGGGDPLGMGVIQSFARPGGNVTGVTDLDLELAPKRLEIFRQIIPGLRRVLFPYDANKILKGANPGAIPVEVNSKLEFAVNLKTARALGLAIAPEVLYQANRVLR